MIFFFFSFLFLNSSLTRASTHRGGAELLNESAYAIKLESSYFLTAGLFDSDGEKKELIEGDKFQMIDSDFKLSYGISHVLESALFFKWRAIEAVNQTHSVSNSGPESAGVEFKYAFPIVGRTRYALGVHYLQTLYTNTNYPTSAVIPVDSIILGDDGSEYGVSGYMTYTNRSLKFDSYLKYVSPPNDLSSEIRYKAEWIYFFTKLSFNGGVEGIFSLHRDQLEQKPFLARGPSNIFNSLNRQYVAPFLGFNYSFEKFLLSLKGQSLVSGRSYDRANAVALAVTWNSEGVTLESSKVESFKEYHIEGSVLKVSVRGNFIKIDQGLSTDVEKGSRFDIYQTDYFGGNVLVGSGIVYEVGSDWAVIKLLKKYKEMDIKPGFAARGY